MCEDLRIKIIQRMKGKMPKNILLLNANKKGSGNPAWKGVITSENYRLRRGKDFASWRKKVYERDKYICQKCKIKGGKLHPHHIMNFSDCFDERFDISNGITLCKLCHMKFHKLYGYRNNNHEQIEEFIR